MDIDYITVKKEYMRSKQNTLKKLAQQYGIPYAALRKYACGNGWYRQKQQAQKQVLGTSAAKRESERKTMLSQTEKINEIADKLLENICLSSDVTDKPTSIYNLTSALKNVTAVLRDVNELPNWKDRQSAEMAQLKLELAKCKAETEPEEESGGVVLLPEIKAADAAE